ncbi:MAG: phosphoglycolate phosphatase [Limnohabitans sp.]|jgi:phosphoglycolate phosphatase|uniref:phosphoglycolate phosphatase n=1 Tax=Limnohabitans sp. TaxID=1907725 RepID=UPI0025EAA051|nr:phosphoglycolate phosphatase [Limnohabitans sp.]MCO4089717.1 phosphoglycolate phosphatase [Limnohabitans sp.]
MTVDAHDLTQVEAVIFDLDGTMVNTLGDFQVALNRTMADLNLPSVPDALIEQAIGKGSEHLIRSVLAYQIASPQAKGVGQTCQALSVDDFFDRAWQRYQYHYKTINGQFSEVYPGVLVALHHLAAKGVPMACLTNKPLVFAQTLLKEKSLTHFFAWVFGGDSFERKKPDPLPILKTCDALGTAVKRTLMVGDSSNDADAAHAAGCPVVLVTYGYNHGQPVQNTPAAAWLDTLADLPVRLS